MRFHAQGNFSGRCPKPHLLFVLPQKVGKKGKALPARPPFTALRAKTAELAALEQPPFLPLASAKGAPAAQAMATGIKQFHALNT